LKATLCSKSIIFWIELGAVWAFSTYWGLKTSDMDGSLKRWLVQEPAAKLVAALNPRVKLRVESDKKAA